MRLSVLIAALLVLSGVASAQERWDPAKTYVVMVGITEWKKGLSYQYESFPKRNRADDRLADQLLADGVPKRNLVLLQDKDATADAIRSAVADMAKKAPKGSTFIFYYNGHGDRDWKTGRSFIVNYDADQGDLAHTAVEMSELGALIGDNLKEGRVLLLGDCCYSGSFSSVVRQFAGSTKIRAASLASVVKENMANATNSYSDDLVKIFAGDGAMDRGHAGRITFQDAASYLRDDMRFQEDQPTEVARNSSFEPDFILRDVDPARVLRTLPGRWQLMDFVDVKVEGHWLRGQIVDERNGQYKVKIWGKTYDWYDQWVGTDSLRVPADREVAKGDKVEVNSSADWLKPKPAWFDGVVTAVREGFARVRYGDLPAFKSEWVPLSKLHYGPDRSAPRIITGTGLTSVLEERVSEGSRGPSADER